MSDRSHASVKRRQKRHFRVRKHVVGSSQRPRLAVYRSNQHIVAQVIDDSMGKTLAFASTYDIAFKGGSTGNISAAAKVGAMIAEKAIEAGITEVVFDRGGFAYHGRVAAVAESAREGGLVF